MMLSNISGELNDYSMYHFNYIAGISGLYSYTEACMAATELVAQCSLVAFAIFIKGRIQFYITFQSADKSW